MSIIYFDLIHPLILFYLFSIPSVIPCITDEVIEAMDFQTLQTPVC